MMGCVLPEDSALVSPSQLHGGLLTRVYRSERLRNSWWAAEASAAASAAQAIATADDSTWQKAPLGAEVGEGDGWMRDAVSTETSTKMGALLRVLFGRCMWLGSATGRVVMVQVLLGAAMDVRSCRFLS
jgi:hypothetical protein